MLFSAEVEKFIWEGIIFLAFILICGRLVDPRFNKRTTFLISCGTVGEDYAAAQARITVR